VNNKQHQHFHAQHKHSWIGRHVHKDTPKQLHKQPTVYNYTDIVLECPTKSNQMWGWLLYSTAAAAAAAAAAATDGRTALCCAPHTIALAEWQATATNTAVVDARLTAFRQ
jgi:hypothetical protein